MANEMINFDDLANDTKFTLKGDVYVIPAITNEKAMALFKMGKNKIKDGKIDSVDLAEKVEEDDDFISFQSDFICAAVIKEGGEAVTDEIVKKWPMKVTLAIVKLINECISGVEDNTAEEKK